MWLIFLFLVMFFLSVPTAIAGFIGAPLALTNKTQIKKLIQKINIKPEHIFYDLGSGTGRVLVLVGKQTKAQVVGFELSPIYWLWTFLNLKINKVKGKVRLKNFFKADFSKADIVFCFLIPHTVKRLSRKLKKEMKRGSKAVSYCFELPGLKPYKILKPSKLLPLYFYHF